MFQTKKKVWSYLTHCTFKPCETRALMIVWLHNAVKHFQYIYVSTWNQSDTSSFNNTILPVGPYWLFHWKPAVNRWSLHRLLAIDQKHFIGIISQLQCPKRTVKGTLLKHRYLLYYMLVDSETKQHVIYSLGNPVELGFVSDGLQFTENFQSCGCIISN